jgi:hypothetical protein
MVGIRFLNVDEMGWEIEGLVMMLVRPFIIHVRGHSNLSI